MMPSNSTEYNKQYYQKNKERLREIRGKWNENNVEKMREYRRRYFQEHKDKWREYGKKRTKKYYYQQLEEENRKLKEDNELLNNELAWMKAHTRYSGITQEEYIDGTMSVTEAKLRMRQAEDKQNYISKLEQENNRLKEEIGKLVMGKSKDN